MTCSWFRRSRRGARWLTLAGLGLLALPAGAGGLEVRDAWVREPPPGVSAAAYLTARNPGPDVVRIVGAESPRAARVEMHRTVVEEGVARMRPVEAVEVPAGGEVRLAPRGLHLMLLDPAPLRAGEEVPLVLLLDGGGRIEVTARVRPGGAAGGHHHPPGHP